jgi:hypothetical protein
VSFVRLLRLLDRIVRHPNSDLWLLFLGAAVVSFLAFFGAVSTEVVLGLVLSVLAAVSLSQIRTRNQLTPQETLLTAFPAEYFEKRKALRSSYMFAGVTMDRTLPTARQDLDRLLKLPGTVRVLLPDPSDGALMRMIGASHRLGLDADQASQKIRANLEALSGLGLGDRRAELRVTNVLPRVGINALDVDELDGALMVQHYEFRPEPDAEAGPILWVTRRNDGEWYERFRRELERIWDEATPWPR